MSAVVLGGGLTGLSAAYYLTKKTPKQVITLIESSSRVGGWIKSNIQNNGLVFEQGPRTIRPRGDAAANTLQLIEDLNLTDQILSITSSHPAAKNRMIYAKGALHMLPSSLLSLFKKQELFSKPLVFHLLNDLKADKKQVKDESIYDFTERRFGKEVADFLISPMICGISAGNAQTVSVNFLMKTLFEYEQKYGSISGGFVKNIFTKRNKPNLNALALKAKKEKWSIYSFINGCETLPLALKDNILNNKVDVSLNTECKKLTFEGKKVILYVENDKISTDHVISSIPAQILGTLLKEQHPDLAKALKTLVQNVSVAVVNLHFKDTFLENQAFGFLAAPKEKLPILGVIYDTCSFPRIKTGTTLTVMMGGYWFEEYFGKNPTEDALFNIALEQVQQILKISDHPEMHKVSILKNCMPQYIVGHTESLNFINNYIEKHELPIFLCGASYHGVGINDVILSAKNAVNKIKRF